ncbi:kinase-like protein [Xylariaceae sp. AK1471]|nr:kinase-like protein [Xylariaceae sp. AK1471]
MAAPNNDLTPPHDIQAFTDLDGATGGQKEGVPNGIYTTFWKFYRNGEAYFAQIFKPRLDISIAEVKEALQRVPDADIYPEIPEGVNLKVITTIDEPENELYIKRPSLLTYETSDSLNWTRDIFLGEAKIMDQVSSINHKNIIQYYGCQVRDGRLTGIVLEHHKYSLFEYFLWEWDKDVALDSQRFMEELESAVSHFHWAGLAHNDLKPSNILLGKDHMPVLIDFGSCRPFGGRLMQGGTPGWSNSERLVIFSDKEHDFYSLTMIREWLADPDREMRG